TEKKQRREAYTSSDFYDQTDTLGGARVVSKSAPTSPVGSISGTQKLQRAFSSISSSKHGSVMGSSIGKENIDQLEMLLEAYFVFSDNTLNNLLSLKEYIDDTEDLINITLGSVQNELIKYELLLTAATFVVTIFAVVTGIFGMNFADSVFDDPSLFAWILMITGVSCVILYVTFLVYFRHKKIFPLIDIHTFLPTLDLKYALGVVSQLFHYLAFESIQRLSDACQLSFSLRNSIALASFPFILPVYGFDHRANFESKLAEVRLNIVKSLRSRKAAAYKWSVW
ncbi:hypothetical protein RJ639_002353, partial [Escallonia herrerae]